MYDGTKNRYLDENGNTVLRVLQRIPTVDLSDRMYNSYRMIFIIENNGKTEGIYLHDEYDLVDAARYAGLRCADDKTKEMMEELRNTNGNEKI